GGAGALATTHLLVADINARAQGKTTITLAGQSFRATESSTDKVTFEGSVHVVTDVRGPRGHNHADTVIGGPVIVLRTNEGWRVQTFSYDTKPLRYVPENAATGHDGLTVVVDFVLSYAAGTSAIVTI